MTQKCCSISWAVFDRESNRRRNLSRIRGEQYRFPSGNLGNVTLTVLQQASFEYGSSIWGEENFIIFQLTRCVGMEPREREDREGSRRTKESHLTPHHMPRGASYQAADAWALWLHTRTLYSTYRQEQHCPKGGGSGSSGVVACQFPTQTPASPLIHEA